MIGSSGSCSSFLSKAESFTKLIELFEKCTAFPEALSCSLSCPTSTPESSGPVGAFWDSGMSLVKLCVLGSAVSKVEYQCLFK